jgi:hypothetical protein
MALRDLLPQNASDRIAGMKIVAVLEDGQAPILQNFFTTLSFVIVRCAVRDEYGNVSVGTLQKPRSFPQGFLPIRLKKPKVAAYNSYHRPRRSRREDAYAVRMPALPNGLPAWRSGTGRE